MPPKKKASSPAATAKSGAAAAPPSTPPKTNTQTKPATNTQELPSKERSAFSQVMKLHDSKMFKKALKQADTILKKYPTHGETLAMKGLILCNMSPTGDKSQAYSLIKQGLSYNLRSGVCWHVYGLIYRSDRKYSDSVKCYQQALKITPDNQNVWKDLSNLQIQLRQYDGFVETRRKILTQKPNERTNWLAYAVGNHLLGLRGKALEILDAYEKAKGAQSKNDDTDAVQQSYEDSEMVLYRTRVVEDSGDLRGALDYLQQHESKVVDKLSYRTKLAAYYEQLQQHDKAVELYTALIAINPDNTHYHMGLRRAMKLDAPTTTSTSATTNGVVHSIKPDHTSEQLQHLHTLYTDLANQYPRSSVIRRMPLTYLSGTHSDFRPYLDTYLQRGLRKNIPSLYSDMKPLYVDTEKVQVIESLIEQYIQSLTASNKFSKDAAQQEDASALLWTYVYAASHYDNQHQYTKALQYVEQAIQHTPTLLDLYQLKARIYKHAGDAQAAFHYMNTARLMDTQDRFLNTKAVRYAWRADKQDDAEQIVQLFLRDGDGLAALKDLQVIWYEIHAAEHYLRIHHTSKALKLLLQIDQHFIDMIEDQFDFHTYTLRKMTLRAYLDMLQWADQLRAHRFYFRAATHLVKLYMQIHRDRQSKTDSATATTTADKPQTNGIHTKPSATTTTSTNKDQKDKDEDTDPNGDKLLADTKEPLAEATKFLKHLQHHSAERVETHLLAAELYTLRQKPLLVVKAIKCARAMDADHPDVHVALIKLAAITDSDKSSASDTLQSPTNPTLQKMFQQELQALTDGQSASASNAAYLKRHPDSIAHRLAYAKAQLVIDAKAQKDAVQAVASIPEASNSSWQQVADVHQFLQQHDSAAADTFKQQAHKQYPLTALFGAQNPHTSVEETEQHATDKQEVMNA